ncbi:hypothetical protein F5878DRAFT_439046 [Lentinula raphanica]|uniref:Zn(2)-C6 fungal-type domain-containing protein n=1 Tax=Lentinula raphanica TaxID=153919 RepID=A0AA38PFM8_9AGAR|nr:hypothetical protein F5878DRAFT_439046 [Lentinula raphanica]
MSKRTSDISSIANKPAKRSKASQACTSCRKHKSRCELLEFPSSSQGITCHRCKILNIQCSFESSNIIHLPSSQSHPETSRAILVNSSSASNSASPSESSPFCPPLPPNQLPSPTPSVSEQSSPRHYYETISSSRTTTIKEVRDLRPEDIVSDEVPWGPGGGQGGFDWTAAPILAIHELASKSYSQSPLSSPLRAPSTSDHNLRSVLTKNQITRLLEIFEERYAPWMCSPPRNPEPGSSELLDLIRCTIAARHLDAVTRASVSPRLQRLSETLFLHQQLGTEPTVESIEALLILSLWSPLTNTGYSVKRDGRALASIAVSSAISLGLSEASLHRAQIRSEQVPPPSGLADLTDKTRLWLLTSTMESMACLGTGRTPISRTTEADLKFIDPTSVKNNANAREVRLGFISKMLSLVEQGCKIQLRNPANFESFYLETQQLIRTIRCLNSFIKPLPLITRHEQFFFDMCVLQFHGWNLVLLHHYLRELRTVMDGYNSQSWMVTLYRGTPIPMIYGHEAIDSAQNVLYIFLSQTDTTLLATAPDHVFCLITFAATWIIISNFAMHQLNGVNLGWANDKLITHVAEKLSHIAHSPSHLPAQCAHFIMRLVHIWESRGTRKPAATNTVRREAKDRSEEYPPVRTAPQMSAERTTVAEEMSPERQPASSSSSSFSPSNGVEDYGLYEHDHQQTPVQSQATSNDPNQSMLSGLGFGQEWTEASDMFMDANFWTTFMENLNSEAPSSFEGISS